MKFAHLADTHLGYRQYNLQEREDDFYIVFEKIIDDIIEKKVDFILHNGDMFDASKPPIRTLIKAQKAFMKLQKAGIPIYCIPGNHDKMMRKNAIIPQELFKGYGLNIISFEKTYYEYKDTLITGLPYISPNTKNYKEILQKKLKDLENKKKEYKTSILMLHGSLNTYFDINPEFTLEDIPDGFTYYAMGHLHKRLINTDFRGNTLSYPGSTEIWSTTEIPNYEKMKKGYNLVTIESNKTNVELINIPLNRQIKKITIPYPELDEELKKLKEYTKTNHMPIIHITIKGGDFDKKDVYTKIMNNLEKQCLSIRTQYEPTQTIEDQTTQKLQEYNNKNITNLGLELYKQLSQSKTLEAHKTTQNYYNKIYGDNNDN
ncbi:MAG: exonuclease SbcCD subunit D [Methanobacteriaceae archaeon]|nr:exonuclease SbcCD subunit D [Methanobacteriaceae archaeon]